MSELPLNVTSAGLTPATPAQVLAALITSVTKTNPGYTANLPASLVEDISSTDVYAILQSDSALVELLNSITPFGANAFLLAQLGQVYGVPIGAQTNTSVYVQFTGAAGLLITKGFTVSDGQYQYVVQDGGIIEAGGTSAPLFAVASQTGSWAVPAGTVTQLVTSAPPGVSLSVTNPSTGIPGTAASETETSYRSRVLQAGLVTAQGSSTMLKTLLGRVPGVQPNLISVRQKTNNWEVIVGGGDPYAVAYAVYKALGAGISLLVGSTIGVTGITKANPGKVTTDINHGYATGAVVTMYGVGGMTTVNGVPYTITVVDEKNFTIGVDTSGYTSYTSGGYCTPNNRNVPVSIYDYPDTYSIPLVIPPEQTVSMAVTWNTTSSSYVSPASISQLATPALIAYVNGLSPGQPINQFELDAVFQQAVAPILPTPLLTRLLFSVSINGVGVSPSAGTGIIAGDPESYMFMTAADVTILQG